MKKPTLAQAILMLIVAIIVATTFVSCNKKQECLIDMCDISDIQENDGWYTITLADGNYYEWSKGELR